MRGTASQENYLFVNVSPEDRVPKDHPLRRIKPFVDAALKTLNPQLTTMYSQIGRPSIPPEQLLKAQLLMAFYSVRSDRLFCETLDYNILFRWFLDMGLEEASFVASVFSKNRERLLNHAITRQFFEATVAQAKALNLLSDEHFTVDGTQIEAWASIKSFRPKEGDDPNTPPSDSDPGNPSVDFRSETLSNDTHQSATDPEARLHKKGKGKEAKLSFMGHALMENRNGLVVGATLTQASGTAEVEAALTMLGDITERGLRPKSLAADKGYCQQDLVDKLEGAGILPHIALKKKTTILGLTPEILESEGYKQSQKRRKRVEEIFGWKKIIGRFAKTRFIGIERSNQAWELVATAYNLLRMGNLTRRAA